MEPWLFFVFAFISLATLVLFIKVNLVIKYNNGLRIYYKILFVKIPIFPFKKANPSEKVPKKSTKKKPTEIDEIKATFDIISRYKDLTKSIFGFYFRALHFKILDFDLLVATKKPSTTALTYSFVMQGITYFGEYIQKNSKLVIPKSTKIHVRVDFLETNSHFKAHFLIYTHLGQLLIVGLVAFFKMLFSLVLSFISFLKRWIKDGTIKTKRAN